MNSAISAVVERKAMEMANNRAQSGKKNQREVIAKRITKAAREKSKRERLNELFLALSNSLELSEQNNVKASVLDEAILTVKNTQDEINHLWKENAALLFESKYVSIEKKEVHDENSALKAQIEELKHELKKRVSLLQLDLNVTPSEFEFQEVESHVDDDDHHKLGHLETTFNSLYIVPVCSNTRPYEEPALGELACKPSSVVNKPHPRYPTAEDSWTCDFLKPREIRQ